MGVDAMEYISETGSIPEYLIYNNKMPLLSENEVLKTNICWFSRSPDKSEPSFYDITRMGCPTNNVHFIENGVSDTVSFTIATESLVQNISFTVGESLYVHCE